MLGTAQNLITSRGSGCGGLTCVFALMFMKSTDTALFLSDGNFEFTIQPREFSTIAALEGFGLLSG